MLYVDRAHTYALATKIALSTKVMPKKRPTLTVPWRTLSLVKTSQMVTHETQKKLNLFPVHVELKGGPTRERLSLELPEPSVWPYSVSCP